ncbi:tyrosine-type recombinase/integrase [Antarctobacter heliothermus]|uniref:Phage integrase family protein n=1 Tax=Antarctobacter heliothermus TaxID=74033 RepID=A0A239K2Z5_9RHOB|nr:Phage integrase family protein [Antarctobacter heliothermus]
MAAVFDIAPLAELSGITRAILSLQDELTGTARRAASRWQSEPVRVNMCAIRSSACRYPHRAPPARTRPGSPRCSRRATVSTSPDRLLSQKDRRRREYAIPPELAEELTRLSRDAMVLIHHRKGLPYNPEALGNWFKEQCKAAGLIHCSLHGIRKGQVTRIANDGSSPDEVMACLAHKTNAEGATYTKKADRGRLADSGLSRPSGAQCCPIHRKGWTFNPEKRSQIKDLRDKVAARRGIEPLFPG